MPAVTAPTRVDQNGQSTTYFVDSVGTTVTTYTYPVQQDALVVVNNGSVAMTLTVNGTNYNIQGNASQRIDSPFTSFAISAVSGTQSFSASAVAETTELMQLTGSNVALLSAVTATGAGSPQPVGSFKTYVFEVYGTASAFTVHLEVVGPSGTARTVNKVWDELNNGYLSTSDITAAGFYSVSVPAFSSVQANATVITGGNVSVKGGLMP